ncbi:YeeE/YedE family protein [Methylibium sp.]|uniref:YeeE/YedE family protein n=1 Tax=Methylibium sp. TaxID=2067992 RepID=UPI00286C7616|nr:YeeE/YedE family protein [Methylibium sp.]
MQDIDPTALARQVLWAAFGLAVLFGAIAQRTHFCTMGAVSDIVNMGDWTRMRMWVLAIAVAVVGFNGMVALGWLEAGKTIYAGPQVLWLSALVGGLMFGFGMVLASGCGSKSLVRVGGGNLKSLVVVLVLAVSAFATLKGITAVLRANTVDRLALQLAPGQDLPSLIGSATGVATPVAAGWLGLAIGAALLAWVLRRPEGRSANVWLGGLGIGAVIVALWWVSGRLGYLPEHPSTLEEAFLATNSRRMESLSMAAPVGYALDWLLFFSDKSKLLTIGVVSVAGVVVGSAAWALASGSFRWEGFANVEDTANHLAGGALMGVGGVTALGCTVGQGLSGVSTLALGSFVALAAIVGGALLALRYQGWRIERMV